MCKCIRGDTTGDCPARCRGLGLHGSAAGLTRACCAVPTSCRRSATAKSLAVPPCEDQHRHAPTSPLRDRRMSVKP
eukprot:6039209-Alexandrium_andersonii.AAC.1